jgi:hypothetical protein
MDVTTILLTPARWFAIGCLAAFLACNSGNDLTDERTDDTPPEVTTTSPANNSNDADVTSSISVTFSEAMDAQTISPATFTVSEGVSGTVSYAGQTATLTPSADLQSGTTYTATISTGVKDVAGNSLAQTYSWTFQTAAPATPVASMPFAEGKRWRYTSAESNAYCGGSSGCSREDFTGEYFLHTEGQMQWQGRATWRLAVYRMPPLISADPPSVRVQLVSQGPEGLERWITLTEGGTWRTIISSGSPSYRNGTFLLVGGPSHEDDMSLSASSATVPAGTFSTIRVFHEYSETGEYAPKDIFETRSEEYADGIGLIRGQWDYSLDDNDPRGNDVLQKGTISLTHIDDGPFPDFVAEAEPNDTTTSATLASAFVLMRGATVIGDPGSLLTDADVGCEEECIHPNKSGEKRIQDWYRLDLAAPKTVRIDLVYQSSNGTGTNDLDLYAFDDPGTGLRFGGASTGEPGIPEVLNGTLPAGTYYLGVQAWDTPAGPVPYWISIR